MRMCSLHAGVHVSSVCSLRACMCSRYVCVHRIQLCSLCLPNGYVRKCLTSNIVHQTNYNYYCAGRTVNEQGHIHEECTSLCTYLAPPVSVNSNVH